MIDIEKILEELDEDQNKAVTAPLNKATLVRSSAGSGKTRVLTSRCAYLEGKVPGIMLMTFTCKAANEMIERLEKLGFGKNCNTEIIAGTFHHIASIFLRKYSNLIDIEHNYTIIDSSDQKSTITKIRKEILSKIPKNEIPKEFATSKQIIGKYSFFRNKVINKTFEQFLSSNKIYPIEKELILKIVDQYEEFKKEENIMDFDDLIINFRKLLLASPKLRQSINRKYPAILCDEYQDSNKIQWDIIELLDKENLIKGKDCIVRQFVVGDEGQGIYSWRGGDIKYILNFNKDHINAATYILRFNYRSGEGIVKLAENALNSKTQKEEDKKIMLAYRKSKIKPSIMSYFDDYEQADSVAEDIVNNKLKLSETAILVRNKYFFKYFEMALKRKHIKYKVVGGQPFHEKTHIKDILSFLNFQFNNKNLLAFSRMLSFIPKVGPKTASKIHSQLKELDFNFEKIENIKFPKNKKEDILSILNLFIESCKLDRPGDKINYVYYNFYKQYLEESLEDINEEKQKKSDIEYFIEFAKSYEKLDDLLQDLVLENENKANEEKEEKVIISTIHKAKGLEWENVFLPYLNEDILPSKQSKFNNESLHEELRLFYVAITRAKKHLKISYIDPAFCEEKDIKGSSQFIQLLDKNLFILK